MNNKKMRQLWKKKRAGSRKRNVQGKNSMRDSQTMFWTEKTVVWKEEKLSRKTDIEAIKSKSNLSSKAERKWTSRIRTRVYESRTLI